MEELNDDLFSEDFNDLVKQADGIVYIYTNKTQTKYKLVLGFRADGRHDCFLYGYGLTKSAAALDLELSFTTWIEARTKIGIKLPWEGM